jgi:hypothetical protein
MTSSEHEHRYHKDADGTVSCSICGRCTCHWIDHPCGHGLTFMEPHPECPIEEHRRWWHDWQLDCANEEIARLIATAPGIDPHAVPPSLEELLAGTEFEHELPPE